MATPFIVVRHGETEWNKIEKQQGQLNSNLTELGVKQAHAMAEGLREFPIDLFFPAIWAAQQKQIIIGIDVLFLQGAAQNAISQIKR